MQGVKRESWGVLRCLTTTMLTDQRGRRRIYSSRFWYGDLGRPTCLTLSRNREMEMVAAGPVSLSLFISLHFWKKGHGFGLWKPYGTTWVVQGSQESWHPLHQRETRLWFASQRRRLKVLPTVRLYHIIFIFLMNSINILFTVTAFHLSFVILPSLQRGRSR